MEKCLEGACIKILMWLSWLEVIFSPVYLLLNIPNFLWVFYELNNSRQNFKRIWRAIFNTSAWTLYSEDFSSSINHKWDVGKLLLRDKLLSHCPSWESCLGNSCFDNYFIWWWMNSWLLYRCWNDFGQTKLHVCLFIPPHPSHSGCGKQIAHYRTEGWRDLTFLSRGSISLGYLVFGDPHKAVKCANAAIPPHSRLCWGTKIHSQSGSYSLFCSALCSDSRSLFSKCKQENAKPSLVKEWSHFSKGH